MMPLPSPEHMRTLPIDGRGFPVPWFVAWVEGKPDFRCVAEGKLAQAVRHSLCWICGKPLGPFKSFVTGPLCAVNGVAAEPASHEACGVFSAKACPFLSKPRMRRNGKDLAEASPHPVGPMIDRNPGITLVWTTQDFRVVPVGDGVVFRVGPPETTLWFAEGREATRAEVMASIESGLPILRAEAEKGGPEAMRALERLSARATRFLPPASTRPASAPAPGSGGTEWC